MPAKAKLRPERIKQNKDGTYSYRLQLGHERVTIIKATVGALKEEVGRLIEEHNERARGIVKLDPDRPRTFGEGCERMLDVYRGRASSKETFKANLRASRARWEHVPFQAITRYEGEKWLKDMATKPSEKTGKPLAHTTQAAYLKDAIRALDFFVVNDWLDKNRLAGLEVAITDTAPCPWESWEDVFAIADAFVRIGWKVGTRMTLFGAGLGLRPQEFCVARRCDLDLEKGEFSVQRTWDDTLRIEYEGAKTKGSLATVPLTQLAREGLGELPPVLPVSGWRYSPLLFSHEDGSIITPDYFGEKWREAVETAGLTHRYKPPKSLRHTFCTHTLLRMGLEHIKTVAVLARHDSYRTTEQSYLGLVNEMRRKAGAAVAAAGEPSYEAHAAEKHAAGSA